MTNIQRAYAEEALTTLSVLTGTILWALGYHMLAVIFFIKAVSDTYGAVKFSVLHLRGGG
jgi:hypothetical protein